MKYLQKLGKAIMLPVAVLPVAAIMMGIGYAMCPATMQGGDVTGIIQIIGFALVKIGSAVIDKLPMLFAVGVAIGLSKDQHGAAGLAGLVAFLTVTTVLNSGVVATMMNVEEAPLAFSKIDNAFIGIISGITASICYNRFSSAQLPTALAFFSGKRCVPIVTSFVMVAESAILYFVWPMLFNALVWVGEQIMGLGPVGAGLYAFANRLLIPTGLHHALNAVFWFDIAGIADINKFWGFAEGGIKGVTEPLEFSFMFLAPGLYLVHAVLTGISVAVAAAFHWTAGFCFSAGVTDFIFSCRLPMANQPFMLLVQGVVFAVIYYVVFRAVITKFDLPTPGREKEDLDAEMTAVLANDDFTKVAAIILEGLGGKGNVVSLDNCITRLRLEIKDYTLVDEKKIKSAGVAGVMRPSKTSVQVIVGTKVQFVADEMQKML